MTIESDHVSVQTILELGAEGGSITLQGQRDLAGAWRFRVVKDEVALRHMLDEEPDDGGADGGSESTSSWESWGDALNRLNQYPWPQLRPVAIRAEFADAIFHAVAAHENGGVNQVMRWREILNPGETTNSSPSEVEPVGFETNIKECSEHLQEIVAYLRTTAKHAGADVVARRYKHQRPNAGWGVTYLQGRQTVLSLPPKTRRGPCVGVRSRR